MITDRPITADFAVTGIHVVDRETHVFKAIVPVNILFAGGDENAIPTMGQMITLH